MVENINKWPYSAADLETFTVAYVSISKHNIVYMRIPYDCKIDVIGCLALALVSVLAAKLQTTKSLGYHSRQTQSISVELI